MPNKTKKFWSFKPRAEDGSPASLYLYGVISSSTWWGDEVTPKQFKKDLDALGDIDELDVFINSDGGDVFAGQAILSMLKRHKATVTVHIDGLAASIASVIAMAGDVIMMPVNSMMMVHNPWTFGFGNAEELRKMADDLDKIRETIIAAYQEKSGMDREKIIELMDAETWLTAEEAVDYGLADEIEDSKTVAAQLVGNGLVVNGQNMDLSRYHNAPKLLFVQPSAPVPEKPKDEKQPANDGLLSLLQAQRQITLNRSK